MRQVGPVLVLVQETSGNEGDFRSKALYLKLAALDKRDVFTIIFEIEIVNFLRLQLVQPLECEND